MIMILMTDCSSLDEMLPKEHNADAYGRWYGEAVAFVGDYTENEVDLDDFTCIDDIIGPALIETMCLDNDREEMIALVKKLDPKNYIYTQFGLPSWQSARKKIIKVLHDIHDITAADFNDDV